MTEEKNTIQEAPEEKSFFSIIVHSFFIIPFLIAVFCLLLFTAVHLLTREQRTVFDYLEDVKAGGASKRWQSAFELSRMLANPKLIPQEDRFIQEMILAFRESQHDDNRVRQYLALAMGRTEDSRFNEALLTSLKGEKEDNLPALIYALGMLKQKESAAHLHSFLQHPNSLIRSITAVALGNIKDPGSVAVLKKSIFDAESNVQWGSAISLAQMGSDAGKNVLLQLLNRSYYAQFPEVDQEEQNNLVLMSLDAAINLNDEELNKRILEIAQIDQNMKVRAKALELAQEINK